MKRAFPRDLAELAAVSQRKHPLSTHPLPGSDSERQSVGEPGHCEACARYGHVTAHPGLGCGDVGCYRSHGPEDTRDHQGERRHADDLAVARVASPAQLTTDGREVPVVAPGAMTRRQPIEVTRDRMAALAESPHPLLSFDERERLAGLVGALDEIIDGRRSVRPTY